MIRKEDIMTLKAIGFLTAAAAAATWVLLSGNAVAQGRMRGGMGPAHYDAAAEVTVKGTVEDFKQGPAQGTHVILNTPDGTVELALGPGWYQTDKKYELSKGDKIEVIGVKSRVDGGDLLLVREIKKGSETMTFRDAKGFPMWAGRVRR
jgi:hypothetical protein